MSKKKNARQYQDRFVELYEAGRSIRSIVSLSASELVLEYPFALQWVKGSLKSYRLCRYKNNAREPRGLAPWLVRRWHIIANSTRRVVRIRLIMS